MAIEEIIKYYLERYKNDYIYNIYQLLDIVNIKDINDQNKFLLAMLNHNKEIKEKEHAREISLKKLSEQLKQSASCSTTKSTISENLLNSNTGSTRTEIDITKELNIIRSCNDEDTLIIILQNLKDLLVSPFVVRKIIAELQKELNYAHSCMLMATSEEEIELYTEEISLLEWKTGYIFDFYSSINEEVKQSVNQNSETEPLREIGPIYICSNAGNPYALTELRKMSKEYYEDFRNLIDYIHSGGFLTCRDLRRCRKFTNNGAMTNAYEVKGFEIRIVLMMLTKNKCAILGAFIKKTSLDLRLDNVIKQRLVEFNPQRKRIIELLNDEEFMKKQKKIAVDIESLLEGRVR